MLFAVYVDELIFRLKSANIRCKLLDNYYGCLLYAVDIVLLAHTLNGMEPVAYLGGGPCARPPPPFGQTAVIFVTILGLFLAPFRDKIAATSDQMRFFGRKML